MANKKKFNIPYPKLLVGASLIGLIASFWQAVERVQMLKNPGQELSCNLSPVVECGSVLENNLAAVFGPPNAFIGMVVFSILLAFGLQRLNGGKWNSIVRNFALFFSVVIFLFSIWFFAVSLYVIGKICIFCIFIWAVSMPIGLYGVKDYLENKSKTSKAGFEVALDNFLKKHHFTLLVTIYAVLIVLFLLKFKEYYFG